MQILCDLDTETLAGLRNALYLIEQTIDARGGFIRDDEMPPGAQMVCGVPCVLASDVPTGTNPVSVTGEGLDAAMALNGGRTRVEAPPAGLGFGEPPLAVATAPAATIVVVPAPVVAGANVSAAPLLPATELDSAGLPWDARIHSDTHKKNADGSWRFRRNLDEAVKVTVLAELTAQGAPVPAPSVPLPPADVPAPVPNVPTPPGPNVPPVRVDVVTPPVSLPPTQPAGGNITGAGGATGTNVIPQPPVTPPAAVPVPPPAPMGMPDPAKPVLLSDLIAKINKGFGAKTLTMVEVTAACEAEGLAGITALGHHPGKVQAVIDRLKL